MLHDNDSNYNSYTLLFQPCSIFQVIFVILAMFFELLDCQLWKLQFSCTYSEKIRYRQQIDACLTHSMHNMQCLSLKVGPMHCNVCYTLHTPPKCIFFQLSVKQKTSAATKLCKNVCLRKVYIYTFGKWSVKWGGLCQ